MSVYESVTIHSGEKSGANSTKNAQDLATVLTAMNAALVNVAAPTISVKADNYTVTTADNETIFQIATDAKVFTLPLAAVGLRYTFQNTGAAAAVLVSILPQTGEKVHFVTAVATKKLLNTKSTANMGDMVTLVSDGTGWYPVAMIGTWAKEG